MSSFVPSSWSVVGLKSIVTVCYGKALSASFRSPDGLTPVIGSSGAVGRHDLALVDGPCIVIGRKGAAGSVHLINESSWPIDTAFYIQPPSGIDLRYLYYFLSSLQLGQLDRSTAIPSLSRDDLYGVDIRIAPSSEQSRIVEKLEELLSDLDAGMAELKAARRKLNRYRQSLLKAAVEGTLTADWRAANGEPEETGAELLQRILSERRASWEKRQLAKFEEQGKTPPKGWQAAYSEPASAVTSGLRSIPQGWVWATAEQLCDFITKGTTPPKSILDTSEERIPFLRVTNLTSTGELDFSEKVFVTRDIHEGFLARSIVYPRDVLMNIVGPPLGQVSIVPPSFEEWNINQAIAVFRAVKGVLPAFIATYLLSNTAQRWLKARAKTTAGQTNLTLETCRSLPVPLPPLQEQQALTEQLDAQLGSLAVQLTAVNHGVSQASAQRKNLLKAAFAGQLVPQDPNDEPASELLARIRAARDSKASGSIAGKRGRKPKVTP